MGLSEMATAQLIASIFYDEKPQELGQSQSSKLRKWDDITKKYEDYEDQVWFVIKAKKMGY